MLAICPTALPKKWELPTGAGRSQHGHDCGRSRGFAFVEMTDAGEAEKAIAALNGTELGGRALKINEAKPKTERPRGGGQGFGRSGGGGRQGGGGGGRDDYRGHARQPREPRW